jgi:signal transduction histidine kinase
LTAQVLSRTIGIVPRFDATKTLEDQVTEIEKLVSDAQQQLRQVSYALETLKTRIDALAAASRD